MHAPYIMSHNPYITQYYRYLSHKRRYSTLFCTTAAMHFKGTTRVNKSDAILTTKHQVNNSSPVLLIQLVVRGTSIYRA